MNEMFGSSRRQFLKIGATGAAGAIVPPWALAGAAPAIVTADSERPQALQGLHVCRSRERLRGGLEPQRSTGAHAGRMVVRRAVQEASVA